MRVHERESMVRKAKVGLEIRINDYRHDNSIEEDVEFLRAVTFEMRELLLDMEPAVKRAERFSWLKDMIKDHMAETGLTSIETLQALSSTVDSTLKYMLRYERHGDYETPAGLAKE